MQTRFKAVDAENLIDIYGFSLFPLYGIAGGKCTCGKEDCSSAGKHPLTPKGFHNSTKNMDELRKMFPSDCCNVGIATGEASGVFVVDIDDDLGRKELEEICELPPTLMATTGRGTHFFYKWPGEPVISRNGFLNKVDIKGDGGYVVGAGSLHQTGTQYQFINPLEDIAEAPKELLDLVVKSRIEKHRKKPTTKQANFLFSSDNNKTPGEVREMLSFISPNCGYQDWLNVGMALHSEMYDCELWDDWSANGDTYEDGLCYSKWETFKTNGGVSFGTIYHMAREGGYDDKPKALTIEDVQKKVEVTTTEEVVETGEVAEKERNLFYISGDDIDFDPDCDDFVQDMLMNDDVSVIYGRSNCGKTFFIMDLCYHIVEGREYRGKRVEQGEVMYVALEGARGVAKRIQAHKKNSMGSSDLSKFHMMPCGVDFLDPEGNIKEFIDILVEDFSDKDLKMIVIDTLARAIGGGDENSGTDMGILVKHADVIREVTGAHVCFVHHSGKDKAKGARGHSSLQAAIGTEIEIVRGEDEEYATVKFRKQKDVDMGEDMYFGLKSIPIGVNKYNEEVSSCVVEPVDGAEEKVIKLKGGSRIAYDALVEAIDEVGKTVHVSNLPANIKMVTKDQLIASMDRRALLPDKEDSARTKYYRLLNAMTENGAAYAKDGYIWLS